MEPKRHPHKIKIFLHDGNTESTESRIYLYKFCWLIAASFPATLYTQPVDDSDSDIDDHIPLRKVLQKKSIIESDEDEWSTGIHYGNSYGKIF